LQLADLHKTLTQANIF